MPWERHKSRYDQEFYVIQSISKARMSGHRRSRVRDSESQGAIIMIMNQINELFEQYGDIGLPLMQILPPLAQFAIIRRYSQE
jgi:hypothetical protein